VIPGLSCFSGQGWWTWTKGTRSMEQIVPILCCITFVVGKRRCSILVSHFSSHYVCIPITCTQTKALLLTSHTNCRVQQGTRTTRTTWTAWESGEPQYLCSLYFLVETISQIRTSLAIDSVTFWEDIFIFNNQHIRFWSFLGELRT